MTVPTKPSSPASPAPASASDNLPLPDGSPAKTKLRRVLCPAGIPPAALTRTDGRKPLLAYANFTHK